MLLERIWIGICAELNHEEKNKKNKSFLLKEGKEKRMEIGEFGMFICSFGGCEIKKVGLADSLLAAPGNKAILNTLPNTLF